MKIKQVWIDNPRQDFWARFRIAIELKTGQRFYTDSIMARCDYPKSQIVEKNKYVAFLIPHESVFMVPCDRNKLNATYWLEVGEDEPFYLRILEDFGIELSDFWDGEPYW
jgi:hypothetical protein